jgi:hypothetical protein
LIKLFIFVVKFSTSDVLFFSFLRLGISCNML